MPLAVAGGHGNFQRPAAAPASSPHPGPANPGGPTKPFNVTQAGRVFDTASAVTSDAGFVGGAGTLADPYVIDSVHYTSGSVGGDFDPGTITGKYIKFTQSWFQGNVSTGDLDPLSRPIGWGINGRTAALPTLVTYEDCLFAPTGSPVPAGGPDPSTGGMGYCLYHNNTPFVVRRCNMWGAAANFAYTNQGASAPDSYVYDTWSHDQWVSGGAHTDNFVGNDPPNASNIHLDNVTLDGKCGQRGPNSRVVNCFAAYNTNPITNLSLNNCLVKNGDFGLFWAGIGVGASITNITVTNTTFDLTNLGAALSGRTDILTQSGNVDQNGDPVVL